MTAPTAPPAPAVLHGSDDAPDGPSKSQRKRDSHALQALGERLVELAPSALARLDLPPELVEAVVAARKITSREGRRRQIQYVGKIMRRIDGESVRAQLDVGDAQHRAETAVMHAAERWRDALIAAPDRLAEFLDRYPQALSRDLHPMVRAAAAEVARQQHGRHFRELYRELRDLLLADLAQRPEADADAAAGR